MGNVRISRYFQGESGRAYDGPIHTFCWDMDCSAQLVLFLRSGDVIATNDQSAVNAGIHLTLTFMNQLIRTPNLQVVTKKTPGWQDSEPLISCMGHFKEEFASEQ